MDKAPDAGSFCSVEQRGSSRDIAGIEFGAGAGR
jgi:hypothetical protein